jgi:hypothetical protein
MRLELSPVGATKMPSATCSKRFCGIPYAFFMRITSKLGSLLVGHRAQGRVHHTRRVKPIKMNALTLVPSTSNRGVKRSFQGVWRNSH